MNQRQLGWATWAMMVAVLMGSGDWLAADARASVLSSLSGSVFLDHDINGIYDPLLEWVFPNVEVSLTQAGSSSAPVVVRTNDSGFYQFSGLGAGQYSITQPMMPGGYMNVKLGLGRLVDAATGQPVEAFPGTIVNYNQLLGIPPHFAGIQLPANSTRGVGYNFGQIWTGKAWYLTDPNPALRPPHARPPIPEPTTMTLLAIGWLCVAGGRRLRGR
ncbi:MAG: hypothetical protein A2W31_12665 [Planctomycetes bacterium RBG_16_64_10]|nr:MAG: hypothetical protein A2W31_12665 [Planctomycetes bacterium RBG_16_64_10]